MDTQTDRRNNNPIMALVQLVHEDVSRIAAKVDHIDGKMGFHAKEQAEALAVAIAELTEEAFIAGDLAAHRRQHKAQIEAVEQRAEFWRKLLFELTKYGLIAFVGWLALNAWHAFLQGPKQ